MSDGLLSSPPVRAAETVPASDPLLSVRDLETHFFSEDGVTRAVRGVSFDVRPGEMLGIVGESGCGKSVTSLSVLRLLPPRAARVAGGSIRFEGRDLLSLDERAMRDLRGNRIAMIFQEPMTSLNPVFPIGEQIAEAMRIHERLGRREARERTVELLRLVKVPDPARRLGDYPHQFSGGMRQRVMIAMALACKPRLLIADEPTTALDVTIQAQILRLMLDLREATGAAVMLITHDLGVVAETCQRVMVMYAGRKVEEAPVEVLFDRPAHPYTRGLMASKPQVGAARPGGRLAELPGMVPSLRDPIPGCAFAPRCAFATPRCATEAPQLRPVGAGHHVECHEAERVLAGENGR
ncbi:ABC transporter ATP-binding protein [Azospirillum sp. 412522]|nr:ABC transporter ATP-binding protein [Azospirillum sp. 412522]MBY6262644.1 ABC transporter ATP-binding protein [Azospirillum sp. 412522]